jgi:hypothetical protein
MAQTSIPGANGKYEPPNTGSDTSLSASTKVVTIRPAEAPSSPESMPIAKMYAVYSDEHKAFTVDAPIAMVSKILEECLEHFRAAAAEENELERENHVSVGWSHVRLLGNFIDNWPTFDEALSLLLNAFLVHRTWPYGTKELVATQKVLEMMRRRPVPTDEDIVTFYDVLDDSGFDLNAPLSGVELNEGPGEVE